MQVYLAVPSNCPFNPDGSKRKLTAAETVSSSVIMYVSGDEGTTFTEVHCLHTEALSSFSPADAGFTI